MAIEKREDGGLSGVWACGFLKNGGFPVGGGGWFSEENLGVYYSNLLEVFWVLFGFLSF